MGDLSHPAGMAALQTGQGQSYNMQALQANPMLSAIQTQYGAQLEQYKESQQQMADWAKKYDQYERSVAAAQQQWQMQQQQYLAYQRQQAVQAAQMPHAPRTALVQTGLRSGSTEEAALKAREAALASRGKALAARERRLQQKAAEVRAEEVKEQQEQTSLDQRDKALAAKEKQVQVFESELVQEQRKIWKVLRSRQAPAANAASSPPAQVASAAPQQNRQTRSARPARVQVATKHTRKQQLPKQPRSKPQALVQMSSNTRVKAVHKQVTHRATSAAGAKVANKATLNKSDLHVVMAANVPKEGEFAASEDDEDAAPEQASADNEDEKGAAQENGGSTDNDDLENILLQQSRSVQRQGDPVESF